MAISGKKLSVVAGVVVVLGLATIVASRSVQYVGGLMVLEVIKPRSVVFDGSPNLIWENGFQLDAVVACNTMYERNVYVRFEKDLPFSLGSGERPEGRIQFQLMDDSTEREMRVFNLRDSSQGGRRSSLSGEKIAWIKAVGFREYPATRAEGCKMQKMFLRFDDLNFDPRLYGIKVVVQRIGIDG